MGEENGFKPEEEIVTAMSTQALEIKLKTLREQSNKHSQALTQKLATSQSGQNLLHIGSSLSTLPPDLHALLTQLHPVVSEAEGTEKQRLQSLQKLVLCGNEIRSEQRRVEHARECSDLYNDLMAAEKDVKRDSGIRKRNVLIVEDNPSETTSDSAFDELDHVASLERAAHTALYLIHDLHTSSEQVSALTSKIGATDASTLPSLRSPLENDTERAQFVMKLAPRIRRLESDVLLCLTHRFEHILKQIQQRGENEVEEDQDLWAGREEDLLMIGHCMRGLALMGKGKEAESVFARVAIMPLIRSKLSMGRLDEGGSRGECAGLFSLLDDMSNSISTSLGPVLQLSEAMFDMDSVTEVDLVTAGVWVPIATALMADQGIKMAIFSPGIAKILQSNYAALDNFLSELAKRLLTDEETEPVGSKDETGLENLYSSTKISQDQIQRAQQRIYAHPKSAEFARNWNLPIYYQLRFGDSCTRLNTAISRTQKEGWTAEVYAGDEDQLENLRSQTGFELSLFVEVYEILTEFWQPDVFLRPLTHRFLRGAVQIVGRVVSFVQVGLTGKLKFGEEKSPLPPKPTENGNHDNEESVLDETIDRTHMTRDPYCWGDNLEDVASVAWELTILESKLTRDYCDRAVKAAITKMTPESEQKEFRTLVKQVLSDVAQKITPIVDQSWNEVIVNVLTSKCCAPLGAVKGVAATYRMTNRPPPKQSSPFVPTILRPLKEFNNEFKRRTPIQIGVQWKNRVVSTVAERYSHAVEELIATVQRTEEALQNKTRRTRRTAAGGMSDGEKIKLQLYLDFQEFQNNVRDLGVDPATIEGITKLRTLTIAAENLVRNGTS